MSRHAALPADVSKVDGVALETLPVLASGKCPAMVLVKSRWRRLYFLLEREGWSDEDYFIHAARLMGQQGILEP